MLNLNNTIIQHNYYFKIGIIFLIIAFLIYITYHYFTK